MLVHCGKESALQFPLSASSAGQLCNMARWMDRKQGSGHWWELICTKSGLAALLERVAKVERLLFVQIAARLGFGFRVSRDGMSVSSLNFSCLFEVASQRQGSLIDGFCSGATACQSE